MSFRPVDCVGITVLDTPDLYRTYLRSQNEEPVRNEEQDDRLDGDGSPEGGELFGREVGHNELPFFLI